MKKTRENRNAKNNIADARRYYEKQIGRKYTQEEAARDFNIGLSTYRNYEQEKSVPDGRVSVLIANKYGVTVDYLMGETDIRYSIVNMSDELKEDEQELIRLYRKLPLKGKHAVISGLRDFANNQ